MKRHVIASLLIISVCFIFLSRLFIPKLQLIATPEFELHDAIQLSYASKWWYVQKLHNFELPLWSSQIGGGFPVLGEGQTSIFFLPNIIIGSLIQNPALAYNLILTFVPITMAMGMYVWFSMLGVPWGLSILGGLSAALSGFTLFHLQHIALLQGFSLIPFLMASTLGMTQRKPKPWIFLFIIFLSQQLCTGFIQAVVIGGMFSFFYYVFLVQKEPKRWKKLLFYLAATIGGVGVSAIQFLPSLEFFSQIASWEQNNPDWPMQYSFPVRFLITFLHPFLIGNPALGTFDGSPTPSSNYWENIGYVGLLPLALTLYAVCSKRIRKEILFFILAVPAAFFLMLGKFSPFYFVFNFFPLNLFRVPSRFIYLFALGLIVISVKAGAVLVHRKPTYVRFIMLVLWTINLSLFYPLWTTYHPLTSPSQIHEAPPITSIIPQSSYIYRLFANRSQRPRYATFGTTDIKRYDFYKNTLMPNTNTFWNYTVSDTYPSRFLKRPAILDALFLASVSDDKKTATMSSTARTLLALTPTDWIISGEPINSDGAYVLKQTVRDDDASLYIYSIPNTTPWAFFPTSWRLLSRLSDIEKIVEDPTFDPHQSVLLEKMIPIQPYPPQATVDNQDKPIISEITQTDTVVRIKIGDVTRDSLFTIGTTYYPGWVAKVDGRKTEIFPVNIRSMGIVVPKGTSVIDFQYAPKSLVWGAVISLIALAVSAILLLR